MTQFERVNSIFIEAVRKIRVVVLAVESNGRIDVVVPETRSPTSTKVFELKAEMLRSYPEAELNIRVIGLDTYGG